MAGGHKTCVALDCNPVKSFRRLSEAFQQWSTITRSLELGLQRNAGKIEQKLGPALLLIMASTAAASA